MTFEQWWAQWERHAETLTPQEFKIQHEFKALAHQAWEASHSIGYAEGYQQAQIDAELESKLPGDAHDV